MVQRERIADNVFSFQSEVYAQVTAGAIIGPNWAVVIDTLALPEETLAIRDFIEQELSVPVRYVIDTHSHADHAWGNYYFPGSNVISHSLCRQLLETRGIASLDEVRKQNIQFRNSKIVLPHITFSDGNLTLRVGKKTLSLFPLPGHTLDNVAVLVEEDRVLFAGDTCMPLPYIVDGNIDDLVLSVEKSRQDGPGEYRPGSWRYHITRRDRWLYQGKPCLPLCHPQSCAQSLKAQISFGFTSRGEYRILREESWF